MGTRLSIRFDGFDHARETVRTAVRAEEAGADAIWMAEHLGYREAAVSCTAFLAHTRRAAVIPTAVMPYLWHPVPTAMQFATMAELAPGRVGLCVSVGNLMNLQEAGVSSPRRPVRAIREYVEAMRALWAGRTVEQQGVIWNLQGARLAFGPPEPIPIFVASTGPRVLALAGEIADGVLFSGGLTLDYTRRCAARAEAGARSSGRDPSELRKAGFVYFACSEDGRAAVESNRRKLAFLFRSAAQADNIRTANIPIDHETIMELVRNRDLDGAARLVPDDAVKEFSVAGTQDECFARLRDYVAAGVDEPVIEVCGSADEQRLALEVIREFNRN